MRLVTRARWLPACGLGLATLCQAAEPAAVSPGLWDVRSLITFERANANLNASGMQPAAASRVEASLPHSYSICLREPRVRAPMMPSRLPRTVELAFDAQTIAGSYAESLPNGTLRQVEFGYRRLAATAFEGSQDTQAEGRIVRLQYYAQRVAADCGNLRPSALQANGEP
jgi:hypothetical protein